jgi:hypothetical protein
MGANARRGSVLLFGVKQGWVEERAKTRENTTFALLDVAARMGELSNIPCQLTLPP